MFAKRSLAQHEVSRLIEKIPTLRDRTLLVLGLNTGFRISEILSLTREDVVSVDGVVKPHLSISRCKGGKSRTVVLNESARQALSIYLAQCHTTKLFPITKQHYWRVLKSACKISGIDPTLVGTHSMRKTFAQKIYTAMGNDIYATSKALGHANIATTVAYLGVCQADIEAAILSFK